MNKKRPDDYKIKAKQLSISPFLYNVPSISSISIRFLILLSIQVLMLALTQTYSALVVVICSTMGAAAAAAITAITAAAAAITAAVILRIDSVAVAGGDDVGRNAENGVVLRLATGVAARLPYKVGKEDSAPV